MLRRFLLAIAIILAALVSVAAPAAAPQRIVAIGDLHGDYSVWLDIARDARLIDARNGWIGGKTILVQLGDITDRGADSLKIIRNLQQLQKSAPKSGGRVVVLLGNHEAMNLLGDLRYTTPGEFAAFATANSVRKRDEVYQANHASIEAAYHAKDPTLSPEAVRTLWLQSTPLGWVEHRAAWRPDGELGRWARNNPAIVKIGDTLFAHGGISLEYSKVPIADINRRVAAAMAAAEDKPNSILNDPLSPLWYRGLVGPDPDAQAVRTALKTAHPDPAAELTAVLAAYGAKRLVVGHTPNLSGILVTDGGKLIRVDTGNSRYYGGTPSWLEIVGDQVIPHSVRRSTP